MNAGAARPGPVNGATEPGSPALGAAERRVGPVGLVKRHGPNVKRGDARLHALAPWAAAWHRPHFTAGAFDPPVKRETTSPARRNTPPPRPGKTPDRAVA